MENGEFLDILDGYKLTFCSREEMVANKTYNEETTTKFGFVKLSFSLQRTNTVLPPIGRFSSKIFTCDPHPGLCVAVQ